MQAAAGVRRALEGVGCSVVDLPFLPSPDKPTPTAAFMLAGKMGMTYLFVVKEPKGKGTLTPTEQNWLDFWEGIVFVVETPEQALGCLNKSLDDLAST